MVNSYVWKWFKSHAQGIFARGDETRRLQKIYEVILRKKIIHAMVESPITKESGNQLKGDLNSFMFF
jgi:hypothetical protein